MSSASASQELRAECDPIWRGLHEHPFITELAAGTLPIDRFRFFIEQDNFYLEDFARCLAMGAAKSRDDRELRYFVTDLNQVLDEELPSNRELLARITAMGAEDRGGSAGMAPSNVAYTSYMRSLALHGGPLEIMASLLPCAWSYVEIATALEDRTDRDHPVYTDWIGYFARPRSVELVGDMREDFDRLVREEASGGARREGIGRIFATASRLEYGFWEMAYTLERWPDLAEPRSVQQV
ncbi:MAG TPA: thiaminase II [Actinomycetota bacterium]|nr:thiaminase II [Actinomycetota bacterium]